MTHPDYAREDWQRGPGPRYVPPPARNPIATAGFVVALIGAVLALIPVVGIVSWAISPVGLVLSAVGLVLSSRRGTGKGLAIAGVLLGVLGLIVCTLYAASFAAAVSTPSSAVPASAPTPVPAPGPTDGDVQYEVTGRGRASVTYTNGTGNMAQETSARLPWTKTIADGGVLTFYSLTVTNSGSSGTVTCRITRGGVVVAEQSASGPYASASCSGS